MIIMAVVPMGLDSSFLFRSRPGGTTRSSIQLCRGNTHIYRPVQRHRMFEFILSISGEVDSNTREPDYSSSLNISVGMNPS